MRILCTGGAGFLGSHLVARLLQQGHDVIVLDNFFTAQRRNLRAQISVKPETEWGCTSIPMLDHPNFEIVRGDVCEPFHFEVDQIYHLACPASPVHYQRNPARTIETAVLGTLNALKLARETGARVLIASTSEVYGDPLVHPQPETYFGNVNTLGPRACYDEGKRCGEALAASWSSQFGVDVRIARIFNTYGPRMAENDGRVVSNFICQALRGKPITIYGDGSQTRSFAYVDDTIDGLMRLMNVEADVRALPVNIGNPGEFTMLQLANLVIEATGSKSEIVRMPLPADDPKQRRPDIARAQALLGWEPKVQLREGIEKTVSYFRTVVR